jgi:hypothetical protein
MEKRYRKTAKKANGKIKESRDGKVRHSFALM